MKKTHSREEERHWYTIKEAAKYLEIGEPTLYRWMREGKITFRKIGDSTRFWKEDLDSVMEIHPSARDAEKVHQFCPVCHHDELVEGRVQGTGLNYFYPGKSKFWTLKGSHINTQARMCARCGAIVWFGDTTKLIGLRQPPGSGDETSQSKETREES